MIMPALPCDHAWRPLFDATASAMVEDWDTYRACDECGAVAAWREGYLQVLEHDEARRRRVQAAYLRPGADRG